MTERIRGRIVLAGAGGHAKVVIELVRAAHPQLEIVGLTDADPTARKVLEVPVIGDDGALEALRQAGVGLAFPAVGDNAVRQRLGERLRSLGFALPALVSPSATVSPSARLGAGVAVMAGAVINAQAQVGDFAIVNTGAVLDHDVRLGMAAHAAPGCTLAGSAVVGDRTLVGVGACLIPGVAVGADSVVGAGAAVTEDIGAGVLAVGVPARVLRQLDPSGTRHV